LPLNILSVLHLLSHLLCHRAEDHTAALVRQPLCQEKASAECRFPAFINLYAVTEDGQHLVLVRQYRYPMDDYLYELPAGLIEPGETASEAACREMIEETGWKLEVYEGGEPAFRRGFFLAQGLTDESGSMIFC